MDKAQLLQAITELSRQRLVTKSEVEEAYNAGLSDHDDHGLLHHLNISEALYYIGAAIVLIGISVFVGQHWEELSPMTRIVSALGSGIVAYVMGVLFHQRQLLRGVGQAFFFLSALLLPLGLGVALHEGGYEVGSAGVQSVLSAILVVTYLSSFALFRKTLFLGFAILFGTWLFFSLTNYLAYQSFLFDSWRFFSYRLLIVGTSYMLFGHFFRHTRLESIADPLHALGIFGFLAAALALGGWVDGATYSPFWQFLFPFLIFGFIFFSVRLKVRSSLLASSFFLMAYILKITAEHFTDSLGWPLALVFAGLFLIGVGFATFSINRRYLK